MTRKKIVLTFKDFDDFRSFVRRTGVRPPKMIYFNPFMIDESGTKEVSDDARVVNALGGMEYDDVSGSDELKFRLSMRVELNDLGYDVKTGSIRAELVYNDANIKNERLKNALDQRETIGKRIRAIEREIEQAQNEFYSLQERYQDAKSESGEDKESDKLESEKLKNYADYVASQRQNINKLKSALKTSEDIVKNEIGGEMKQRVKEAGYIVSDDDWGVNAPDVVSEFHRESKNADFYLEEEVEQDVFIDNYGKDE